MGVSRFVFHPVYILDDLEKIDQFPESPLTDASLWPGGQIALTSCKTFSDTFSNQWKDVHKFPPCVEYNESLTRYNYVKEQEQNLPSGLPLASLLCRCLHNI